MFPKFMRRPTVVMPEAAPRVAVVVVGVRGLIGRSRLLSKGDGPCEPNDAYDERSGDLRSQRHLLLPVH
jgi:hypothetical protein